ERSKYFRTVSDQLRKEADVLATTMTTEMGKPVTQGLAEIEKCAVTFDFYADRGETFLADEPLEMSHARVQYQALGIVLAIMPWNFPFWQVVRCACPILMAGNAMVLKHAPNVMGCAILMERVFEKAGFPANIFRALKINVQQVSAVLAHSAVSGVTLTGS